MLARVKTFAVDGLDTRRVWVEVDIRAGLPAFSVVGLADAAVRESRERVRAALLNSGFEFPMRRITASLAPADVHKVGPGFDLALACGILAASGQVPRAPLEDFALFGELSLGGELRPVRGALAIAEGARREGLSSLILPRERAAEAALVEGLSVAGLDTLRAVGDLLAGGEPPPQPVAARPRDAPGGGEPDLADVRGGALAREALEYAAAGGHNLLLEGAPGTGKTMLARRMPSILPPLAREEAFEVTRIHSIAGLHRGDGLIVRRPFRAPHHAISASGLVGGGSTPTPGEASLAHHGVLFLDELSEFARPSLEALRQPLEDGHATVVRGQRCSVFPTRFLLIAATNPCPCGMATLGGDRCACTEADLARHRRRLSGPLLDRLDLLVPVDRPAAAELAGPPGEASDRVRARVLAARDRQSARLAGTGIACNGQMEARHVRALVRLAPEARRLLTAAYARGTLSARGHHRVLRVARTLADLAGAERVAAGHVLKALALRGYAGRGEAAA
jgi:magnesium chelatase family protein